MGIFYKIAKFLDCKPHLISDKAKVILSNRNLRDETMKNNNYMTKQPKHNSLQWFLDRIGKKVFRNKNGCSCEVCQMIYENGLIVGDEDHAHYLCESVGEYELDGYKLRYFDTKEEVKEFEKHNKPIIV